MRLVCSSCGCRLHHQEMKEDRPWSCLLKMPNVCFKRNKILDLWRLLDTQRDIQPVAGHPVGPHADLGADLVVHVTSRLDSRFMSMCNIHYTKSVLVRTVHTQRFRFETNSNPFQ
jgi:hypothetical protein